MHQLQDNATRGKEVEGGIKENDEQH